MNRQNQLSLNLIASIVAFIINIGISFLLTPYITKSIGVEAYGFVSLGTSFTNYASLVTIALNSMAGRFITIEIHKNNWQEANKYFNSVLLANVIAACVMLIPSIICVVYLEKLVNVPAEILTDVRLLFIFLFFNYLVSIVVSCFSVATFATNNLYLKSLRDIEASIIKAVLLILLFVLLEPAVSYLGFVYCVTLIYATIFNVYYTKKLLPEINIRKAYFDIKAVYELISSGIWNTVILAGQILLQGLNLLIANLFVGAAAMGTLALATTIPTFIISLVGVIAGVFVPDFTILYAKEKTEELLISIKRSMKILGIIINIPVAILITFGLEFYSLWVPNEDPRLLQILSIISVATIIVSGSINSIYGVFTVTNKLKTNAIVLLTTGVLNVAIVFLLVRTTNLGIYAIAGVSTVLSIIRNLVFTVPYGAKYLGLKWTTFYPEVFKSILGFIIITGLGFSINHLVEIESFVSFFLFAGLTGVVGLVLNSLIVLSNSERKYLKNIIIRKLRR
jgi:O-antigen/teichoic acid export membrane protein